ncbi:hypothetical protein HanXRQr2_Chr16g0755121 [Helianthus annuus]|uniref:Uncharacterized protein n=1 Tax=Helianthus annuus TaxID=4232 RepID=A0A251S0G4_HELAN|nr:uncharacterized protein LOC110917262 isoform X2 [Helianthus annuus]KAF5760578.1 hypothetical protein HanXRQr2_Chr16g0755121 [Helianthus annuus]KAJ0443425.1 hypothetical protein HanIR_Chr16g0820591 [Helianthus annuus]KAJ0821740.1 hypothetical protein HanPSC8_Chr16g0723761 [Helianthus annuus]
MKGDSFTVDMEPFSHLSNKDLTLSSRIIRSPSRKESQKETDKKMNSKCVMDDGDAIHLNKASLMAGAMPEKLMLLDQTTDHTNSPQVHHQITIMTSGTNPTTTAAATTKTPGTPTKSSVSWKRSRSFKQSSIINPRRLLMFFATLSSMGTVLLICLTLSMSRYTEDDNSHA